MPSPSGPGGAGRFAGQALPARVPDRQAGYPLLSRAAFWPAAVVLLVLGGSLSPFSFDLHCIHSGGQWALASIGQPPSDINDLATNLFVYVPVGLALVVWLRPRLGLTRAAVGAAAVGGLVSLMAETLQTLLPQRCASWIDVSVNLAGTVLGALLASPLAAVARAATSSLRTRLSARPVSVATSLAAVGLVVAGLWPFDFVADTAQLHRSIAQAKWTPWTPLDSAPLRPTAPQDPLATFGFAGLFAAFGFLVALAERETGRPRRHALETAISHAAILALLIETVQFFVVSRSFDTVDAMLNTIAAGLGAYFAIVAIDIPSRSCWLEQPGVLLRPLLLMPLLLAQVACHVLDATGVGRFGPAAADHATLLWLPFSTYYGRSLPTALAQGTWICAVSGLFALTVATLARHLDVRARWLVAGLATVGLASACEVIRFFGPEHLADATQPLLAAGGAMLAATAWHWLRPLDRAPTSSPAPESKSLAWAPGVAP